MSVQPALEHPGRWMSGCQDDDRVAADELAMKLRSPPSLHDTLLQAVDDSVSSAASEPIHAAELCLVLQCSAWGAARASCRVARAGRPTLLRENRPPMPPPLPLPPRPPCSPDSRERSSAGSSSSPLQQLMSLHEWSFQHMP